MQIAVQWRDPEVFRLCDLNTPNGGIDTKADPDCNTRSETPFQSLPQPDRPCQMQAQVSRDGLISMTDHIVGPTPYYLGNASTSKEMYGLRAEYGVDGKAWSSVHTGIEPQPWLQVQFDGGAKTVSTIIVQSTRQLFGTLVPGWHQLLLELRGWRRSEHTRGVHRWRHKHQLHRGWQREHRRQFV